MSPMTCSYNTVSDVTLWCRFACMVIVFLSIVYVVCFFFFFFFQAEDGIRDLTVTGVQTCALPISGGKPMVVSTWDGSTAPEEQAAPVEQARPFKSRAIRSASPSTPGKTRFVVFGVRGASPPLTRVWGTRCKRPCCNLSRRNETRWASAARDLREIAA